MSDYFWKNKNVFITGINGFVGSTLASQLLKTGANVFGLIRTIDSKSLLFYEELNDDIVFTQGDITNKSLLDNFFSENRIDICFHLAAQVEVGVAARHPFFTWETNIRGTYTLLESLRQTNPKIEAIVVASSDKAYGEHPLESLPYKEHYPLLPKFTYDSSKACADLIAQSYASELFNMPILITRFANIYGPGQLNFSAVIPDAIRSALGYSEFIPRSDGKSVRDFLYVKDVSSLYLRIGQALSENQNLRGEVFNAGTDEGVSVKNVVKIIYEIIKNDNYIKIKEKFRANTNSKGEIINQIMNYDKVKKYFDWEPTTNFRDGLKETITWFDNYLNSFSQ